MNIIYSETKKVLSFVTAVAGLEGIMLSEISQTLMTNIVLSPLHLQLKMFLLYKQKVTARACFEWRRDVSCYFPM